jgi:DNA-binding SARP family transcriptional activator
VENAIEVLWPGSSAPSAANNLRVTLSMLRRLLEPDRDPGRPPFHVRRRGDQLWLTRSRHLDVDLWRARDAVAAGRAHERAGRVEDAVESFGDAAARWAGPLLVDLRDHPVAGPAVALVERELATACATLAESELARGRYADAVTVAERLVERDPGAERGHVVAVATHLAVGDHHAAREAADRCRAALAERGLAPSPATEHVLEEAGATAGSAGPGSARSEGLEPPTF